MIDGGQEDARRVVHVQLLDLAVQAGTLGVVGGTAGLVELRVEFGAAVVAGIVVFGGARPAGVEEVVGHHVRVPRRRSAAEHRRGLAQARGDVVPRGGAGGEADADARHLRRKLDAQVAALGVLADVVQRDFGSDAVLRPHAIGSPAPAGVVEHAFGGGDVMAEHGARVVRVAVHFRDGGGHRAAMAVQRARDHRLAVDGDVQCPAHHRILQEGVLRQGNPAPIRGGGGMDLDALAALEARRHRRRHGRTVELAGGHAVGAGGVVGGDGHDDLADLGLPAPVVGVRGVADHVAAAFGHPVRAGAHGLLPQRPVGDGTLPHQLRRRDGQRQPGPESAVGVREREGHRVFVDDRDIVDEVVIVGHLRPGRRIAGDVVGRLDVRGIESGAVVERHALAESHGPLAGVGIGLRFARRERGDEVRDDVRASGRFRAQQPVVDRADAGLAVARGGMKTIDGDPFRELHLLRVRVGGDARGTACGDGQHGRRDDRPAHGPRLLAGHATAPPAPENDPSGG